MLYVFQVVLLNKLLLLLWCVTWTNKNFQKIFIQINIYLLNTTTNDSSTFNSFRCEIHKLTIPILNKQNWLRFGSGRSLYLSIRGDIKQILKIVEAYHICQLHTKFLLTVLLSMITKYAGEIIGVHQCGFRNNRSTSEHIKCIRQILETKLIIWSSSSSDYRFIESLWFGEEGGLM